MKKKRKEKGERKRGKKKEKEKRPGHPAAFLSGDNLRCSVDLMNRNRCGISSAVDNNLPRFLASLPAALNMVRLAALWTSHRMMLCITDSLY